MSEEKDNSAESNVSISYDNFDREYTLPELVPASVFDLFYADLKRLGIDVYCIILPNETIYYQSIEIPETLHPAINEATTSRFNNAFLTLDLDPWLTILFPIKHELEIVGCMVLGSRKSENQEAFVLKAIGSILQTAIHRIIVTSHKVLLTSNLHGCVVEGSYQELTQKNSLLKKSEKKYRELAEKLEQEVKRKAKEIQETQTQLMHQEKMASIGQLSAGVAHEINNPMGFISSNLASLRKYTLDIHQMIQSYQALTEKINAVDLDTGSKMEITDDLDNVNKLEEQLDVDFILEDLPALVEESIEGAERINKIVADLKDFAHPGEESPTYADINHCIDSTLNIVWNELKYKAEVIREYGDLPMVYCYPRQLNQVFMNLLVNASQAIEKRGEITITTRTVSDYVEIDIQDTGSGIPEEILPKIFDPFFTTKDVGKGTGLGLNLVYNIIKKHQGTINALSRSGQGTTFRIRIPLEYEHA